MVTLVNRAKVNTTTTGTGTINLGSAVDGYQTFADAGVVNTNVVRYTIEDGEAWEIGSGTYSSGTLTRSLDESSTGSLLNLSGEAVVYVTATGSDLLQPSDIGSTVQGYDANIVSDASYVHTDNNYTTTEKNKLAGIEAGATADQTKADIDALGIAASTANTLATARNISLTGDVSGSTNFDGSGNVSITAVVADDSHNHVISNVDGLQTALDGKLSTSGKAADSNLLDGIDSGNFLRSDIDDTLNGDITHIGVLRNTNNANVDGPNFNVSTTNKSTSEYAYRVDRSGTTVGGIRIDGRGVFESGSTVGGNNIWHAGNDGAGSGLDADLLDGQHGSYYTDITSRLGYTPVQQGGGAGQGGNKLYMGWGGSALLLQVDSTNFSSTWPISVSGDAGTVDGLNASQFIRSDATDTATGVITFSDRIQAHEIRTNTNQELILSAGESYSYATGQTGEYVYVNAENGLQINTSPDNWSSGWAGRDTFTFSSSGMQFPDGTTQTTAAPADEQDYGLITGSITTTNDYGALT